MSGICGIVYRDHQRIPPHDALKRVMALMIHRGPDEEAFCVEAGAGLGVCHLALSPDRQVFATNENRTITAVVDGNFYNAAELRERLERRGHQFATSCPFEVVPHLYEDYGPALFEHLSGDFGLALWDRARRLLLLGRDRFGVKPLYFAAGQNRVCFASSPQAMLAFPTVTAEIDLAGYSEYLTFQHTISPRTLLAGISRLPAGYYAVYRDGAFSMHQYWDLHFPAEETKSHDEEQHVLRFKELFSRSLARRCLGQDRLGIFLSGGMDSSSITGMLSALNYEGIYTYTGGWYSPAGDVSEELHRARLVAEHFQTNHHEVTFSEDEYIRILPRSIAYMSNLVADEAAPIRMLIAEKSASDVKIILGGEGGDDVTGGYNFDDLQRRMDRVGRFQRIPPLLRCTLPALLGPALPARLRAWLARGNRDIATILPDEHFSVSWAFDMAERRRFSPALAGVEDHCHDLLRSCYAASGTRDPISQALYMVTKVWLAENLMANADQMLAAYSLDYRSPFLDHELVELAAGMPSEFKVRRADDGSYVTKYILRRALQGILPDRIMQMPKSPFQVPLGRWFEHALDSFCQDYLGDDARTAGYCDPAEFFKLLQQHRQTPTTRSMIQLRNLLFFEMWRQIVVADRQAVPASSED